MTIRHLLPVALMLGISFSYAREASAIADCSVCGPTKPCVLRCSLNCPGPGCFVTTCGEVSPCDRTPFLADAPMTGDSSAVCGADPVQRFQLDSLFATWMQEAVSWMRRAVDHLAVLVEPGRVMPAPVRLAVGGGSPSAG
ncbi:MAG TPA: hypothetical protein VNO33_01625 [Kofleriaceae bacterium]|nr:hypothetical protein [Kofleriaceae bacterium]